MDFIHHIIAIHIHNTSCYSYTYHVWALGVNIDSRHGFPSKMLF